jgi:hypothetical protein
VKKAVVEWSPPPWETAGAAADSQKTADISTVIAEIVGRDGWASGNALTIMIQAKDTANLFARWAESGYSPDDAAVLYITYEGDSPTKKVSYTVTDSTDVEENLINGEMYWNSSDLELGRDGDEPQVVGLQFRDVDIPNGATITDAYIQFTCDEINEAEDAITLEIVGDAADNSDTLKWGSANAYNVSSREKRFTKNCRHKFHYHRNCWKGWMGIRKCTDYHDSGKGYSKSLCQVGRVGLLS